jgi:hypothetical protein
VSDKVSEIASLVGREDPASWISNQWDTFNNQRNGKIQEWQEIREFIFATDTSTTSVNALGWKNTVTVPKLTQIRDNLHSNYLSSLFPNDSWLLWESYTKDGAVKKKKEAIQAYMSNKLREGNLRTTVSQLLLDYIDYGNCFSTVDFEAKYKVLENGEKIPSYIGPVLRRISPLDIVFNPLASSFKNTFKIVRSIHTLGEVKKMSLSEPENKLLFDALHRRLELKQKIGGYKVEDVQKALSFSVDGFGNLQEYYQSNYIEFLTFYGDYYDSITDTLYEQKKITVADRSYVIANEDIPSWLGHAPIYHAGWRTRSDNLWAMGPLDNLVGMQYRLDHLENLKDDAMDLLVNPPLKIIGEVEEFDWGPGAEIHIDENGDVQEMGKGAQGVVTASVEMKNIEERMELYAGAPREAMGVRSPGEKTAFEVQTLDNAASRIFQEKITSFEINQLEPSINSMLESARRNMVGSDIVRVMDDDLGVQKFLEISKEDITASGILRPIGARHFAKKAQDLQNVLGVLNSGARELLAPHTSATNLAKFIEDITGTQKYEIFKPNVAVFEQQETARLVNQASEDLEVEQGVPAV